MVEAQAGGEREGEQAQQGGRGDQRVQCYGDREVRRVGSPGQIFRPVRSVVLAGVSELELGVEDPVAEVGGVG